MVEPIFNSGVPGDGSDSLANERSQYIDFYHVPTGKSVQFKAFITMFNDTFSSEWNDEDVFGRNDPSSTFKGTKRQISLGFDVVGGSEEEAILNQTKLSLLQEMLYGTYEKTTSGASTINGSPLFKIKFLNLIQNAALPGATAETAGLLGKIDGFDHQPDLDAGFFDIIGNDGNWYAYPQQFNIQFNFSVLHQHKLGWANREARNPIGYPYGGKGSSLTLSAVNTGVSAVGTSKQDRDLNVAKGKVLKGQNNIV